MITIPREVRKKTMKRNRDVEGEQARILINFKIVTFLVSLFFCEIFLYYLLQDVSSFFLFLLIVLILFSPTFYRLSIFINFLQEHY